jgi:hypothetical protein
MVAQKKPAACDGQASKNGCTGIIAPIATEYKNCGVIPAELRNCAQWVCWKNIDRDGKPTKIPVQPNGTPAKSSDPETWSTYQAAVAQSHKYAGVGFVFSVDDDFAGVDLDGCRDPNSGYIEPWASEIIDRFEHAYIEVSPSRTGVKMFVRSGVQFDRGLIVDVPEQDKYGKTPAIEAYSSGRYFAVTGQALPNREALGDCTEAIEWLRTKVDAIKQASRKSTPSVIPSLPTWSDYQTDQRVIDRARAYIAKMPPAIAGQRGHDATFKAAISLVKGFKLDEQNAMSLMAEYNHLCQPPWEPRDLLRKVQEAANSTEVKEGYLLGELGCYDRKEPVRDNQHTKEAVQICTPTKQDDKPLPPLPMIRSIKTLADENPKLREVVVDGLLRVGETCNFIAASKAGKTFLAVGLALSVALGRKWLGRETKQGRVLIIDNELHGETLADRLRKVATAMETTVDELGGTVDTLSLRGHLLSLPNMGRVFNGIQAGTYRLIVLDALYRMLPDGTSESDNAQMTALYNMLDSYADQLNASFAVVHHSSKGEQGGKNVTDVGSGAGAISRAADAHLTVRPHEQDGLSVLEGRVRSFQSPEPQTIQFDWPLWTAVEGMEAVVRDPAAKQRQAREDARKTQKQHSDRTDVDFLLTIIPTKGIGKTDLRTKSGWGSGKFDRILGLAQTQWNVVDVKRLKRKGRAKPNYRVYRKHLTVSACLENQEPITNWEPDFTK